MIHPVNDLDDGYRRFRGRLARRARPLRGARHQGAAAGNLGDLLLGLAGRSQTVFGAAPGGLFVIRNVTGLVPPTNDRLAWLQLLPGQAKAEVEVAFKVKRG